MSFIDSSSTTLARASTCRPGAHLSGYELPNNLPYYACGSNPYNAPSTFRSCCSGPLINTTVAHPDNNDEASCIVYCRVDNDQPKEDSPCAPFTYGTDWYNCLNKESVWGESYDLICLGAHGNSSPSPEEGLGGARFAMFQNETQLCDYSNPLDPPGLGGGGIGPESGAGAGSGTGTFPTATLGGGNMTGTTSRLIFQDGTSATLGSTTSSSSSVDISTFTGSAGSSTTASSSQSMATSAAAASTTASSAAASQTGVSKLCRTFAGLFVVALLRGYR